MVRLLSPDPSLGRIEIAHSNIAKIQFAGRDPVVGKTWETWETWVRRFAPLKKVAEEEASLERGRLD